MATIIPLWATIALEQKPSQSGELYPCYILSNGSFIKNLEAALIIAESALNPETTEYKTVVGLLNSFSSYHVWVANHDQVKEVPMRLDEHFGLLPDNECVLSFPFRPSGAPTEAIFCSYNDIRNITDALKAANETLVAEGDMERRAQILGIYESIQSFLTDWEANKANTGSFYAAEIHVQ